MSATGVPASPRDVIACNFTCGCRASSRNSSTPVYPVPPTIPAVTIAMVSTCRIARPVPIPIRRTATRSRKKFNCPDDKAALKAALMDGCDPP
jgi:hypothetical protein